MRADLERVINGFAVRRLELIPGVRLERVGAAVAALQPALPELDFVNRIYGLEDAAGLAAARGAVRGGGACGPGSSSPTARSPPAGSDSARSGCSRDQRSRFPPRTCASSVRTRPTLFAATLSDGHGAPPFARPPVARWAGQPGWRLYLAELDGVPAAAAALVIDGAIGYLAAASTLPAFRGRGCQTALIRRRISDAAAAGCSEVCALTAEPASRRNLERCGLALSYTKTAWRKR